MSVKIVKQNKNKITLQVEIELDSSSMLKSEEQILTALNEAGAAATEKALSQFDTNGKPIHIAGEKKTSKGVKKKKYETPYGVIEVARHVYQGSKGGKTYVPLEIDGRIIGQSTPKFAKQIGSKYGDVGSRKVKKDLEENHGRKVSRKYIQDLSKVVGQVIQTKESSWTYALPQAALEAKTISLGIDGTTSYLVGDGYRETMSGTISFFDEDSNRVHTIYLAQTPEYGKSTFKQRYEQEVQQVKTVCPTAHYTGVADGAADIWTFLTPLIDTATLDFWHGTEYLAPVSKIVSRSVPKQKEWFREARHQLRYEQKGAEKILAKMEVLEEKRMSKTRREKLEASITYFTNHQHQMNYAECAEMGLPIGSGVTEAACKVIVKERLCCSGMMWKEIGAQAVLDIRCLTHTEQRWDQFWKEIDRNGCYN